MLTNNASANQFPIIPKMYVASSKGGGERRMREAPGHINISRGLICRADLMDMTVSTATNVPIQKFNEINPRKISIRGLSALFDKRA